MLELKSSSGDGGPGGLADPLTGLPASGRRRRIRCPCCEWEPDGKKYWQCEKCFARFDTFATHAHCPSCDNSWTWTQCIRCGAISDHEEWYVDEDDDDAD